MNQMALAAASYIITIELGPLNMDTVHCPSLLLETVWYRLAMRRSEAKVASVGAQVAI
jgi:hypothetical protein